MKARILYPLLLITLLARFAYPGTLYLTFFTDDFFYYLVVARNLVLHHVSSFNLIQPTNGYHPLWLLTLTALYAIFRDHLTFFIALMVLIWLLILGAFRTLAATALPASTPLLLFTLVFLAVVSRTGMEVSLALFFLAQFYQRVSRQPLEAQTGNQAILTGLLASAAILSRLDIAIVIGVYLLLTLIQAPRAFSRILAFAIGLLPVALYADSNRIWFHTLLPISGMAKNLKQTPIPSPSTLFALLHPDLIHILFAWPALIILALFAWQTRLRTSRVLLCVFLHPVLFYLTLSFTSDWPLWTWYLYPLVPVAALLGPKIWQVPVSLVRPGKAYLKTHCLTPAVFIFATVVFLSFARLNPAEVLIYNHALALRDFARTHPGTYAMGDAAGTPAYLMNQPVLQLEGLMADKAFLDRIRQRQPLTQVLADLRAGYYVTNAPHPAGACTDIREPSQAGPHSPTMQARLCTPPLLHLTDPAGDLLVFGVR